MAVSIDERVVEMRFNNKQFEEGVRQSMKSLDNLDQSIDNLDNKSLNNLVNRLNAINFDALERGMSSLEKRFSAFGVVGMTVIQDLTHGFESLMGSMFRLINKPLEQIKSGGWRRAMNIENARFQLKGLKVAWDDIEKDISYGVQDTAYGLDAAAKAASQLVASGVKFGETFGETGNSPMAKALRGISGVAAMSNSAYEEISPIFTTIAGQGKVMTMQLRQLEARGLNAAAELGKALGKTEKDVRQMVTDGKIDFQTFAEAMDDAFGQHAKDANETFEGSLSNMKAALSRIGADIGSNVLEKMVGVFNSLRVAINKLHVKFQPFINELNRWVDIVTGAIQKTVEWAMESEEFDKKMTALQQTLIKVTDSFAVFIISIIKYSSPLRENLQAISDIIMTVIGHLLGFNGKVSPIVAIIKVLHTVLKTILIVLTGLTYGIRRVLEALTSSEIGALIQQYLLPLAKVILPAIIGYMILARFRLLKVAAVVAAIGAGIYALQKFDIINKLKTILSVISGIATTISTKLSNAFDIVSDFLTNLADSGKTGVEKVKDFFTGLHDLLFGEKGSIVEGMTKAGEKIKVFGAGLKGFFTGVVGPGTLLMYGLSAAVIYTIVTISNAMKTFSKIANNFAPFAWLNSLAGSVKTMLKNMGQAEKMRAAAQIIATMAASMIALAGAAAILSQIVDPDAFEKIGIGLAAMAAGFGVLVGVLGQLGRTVAQTGLEAMSIDIGKQFSKTIKDFGKVLGMSILMRSFAVSLLIVAAAIIALASAANQYDISGAAKHIEIIFGIMLTFTAIMTAMSNKLNKAKDLGLLLIGVGAGMAAIAGSLYVMGAAIEKFSQLSILNGSLTDVLKVVLAMVTSAVVMGAGLVAMSKLLDKASYNIVMFVVACAGLMGILYVLPGIFNSLSRMLSSISNEVASVLAQYRQTLPLVIAVLGTLMLGVMSLSKEVNHVIRTVALILGVMASIMVMLTFLGKITPDTMYAIVENLTYLSIPIAFISGIIIAIIAAAGQAQHALKAAALLISVPLSILGMVLALKTVELACRNLTMESLEAMFVGLVGIAGSIFIISKMASGFEGSAKALLALSVTILALTVAVGAMTLLAREDPWSLLTGAGAVALAMLAFAELLSKLSKYVSEMKPLPIITMLVGIMGIVWQLGTTMKNILNSGASYGEILSATLGITAIVLAMTNMMMSFSSIYQYIRKMSLKDVGKIAGIIASVMGLIFTFGQSTASIIKSGASLSSIIAVSILTATLVEVVSECTRKIIELVSNLDVDAKKIGIIAATIVSLSVAIAAMGFGLSLIARSVPKDNWAALASIAVGAVAIGALLVVIAKIAENLTNVESMDWKAYGQQLLLIVAFTGDLFLIGWAVQRLVESGIDLNKGLGVLVSMGALLAELGALMVIFSAISKRGSSAGGILAGAAGLTVASVALIAMAQALSMLMKINYQPEKLQSVTSALIELTVVLGGFVAIVGALSQAPITIAGVAVAGAVLAGVFLAMGISIKWAAEGIATLVTAIALLVTAMSEGANLSGQAMDDFVANIESGMDELISYIDTRAEDLGAALGKVYKSFKMNSRSGLGNMLSLDGLVAGHKNMAALISNTFFGGNEAYDDTYYEMGAWAPKSYAQGVTDNIGVVDDAMTQMGASGEESLRNRVDTHSLSMLFWHIGEWAPISYAQGVTDNLDSVEDAGKELGGKFIAAEQKALGDKKLQKKIAKDAVKNMTTPFKNNAKKAAEETSKTWTEYYIKQGDSIGAISAFWEEFVVHGWENVANAATGNMAEVTSATEEFNKDQEKMTVEYSRRVQKTQQIVSDSTQTMAKDTAQGVSDAGEKAVSGLQSIAAAGVETAEMMGIEVPDAVKNAVESADTAKTIGDFFSDIGDVITGKRTLMEVAGEYTGSGIWDGLMQAFDNAGLGELGEQLDSLYDSFIFNETTARGIALEAVRKRFESEERFRMEVEAEARATGKAIQETQAWSNAVEKSIEAQRKAWEMNRYKSGATEWLDDIINGAKEAAEEATSGISDFGDALEGLGDGVGGISGKLRSATSMFGEFDRTVSLSSKNITKNLRDNLIATTEWETGLSKLRKNGLDNRMISEFISSGVEGSYQQVAALSKASKKEIKQINKIFKQLKIKDIRIADAFDDKGNLKKSYLKYLDGIKIPKDFDMGLTDWSKYTGKRLNKEIKAVFDKIDMKSFAKGSKALTAGLDAYVEASTSKSQKATEAFKKYLRETYMASLDEAQKQEFLAKKRKQQEKDITKWYKEQSKLRKETIMEEIRAQDDLLKSYTKTGDEYRKELQKRNKSYEESQANRNVLAAAFKLAGKSGAANEILNNMDDSGVMALLESWAEAGGKNASQSFYNGWAKDIMGNKNKLAESQEMFEISFAKGNKSELDDYIDNYEGAMTKLKKASEIYLETLTGIEDGMDDVISNDKKLSKSIQNISKSFTFMGSTTPIDSATKALEQYALTLLDLEAIEEEAAALGVDSADLIKSHLEDVTKSLKDFRDNIASSLKSALQSFDKFDEGEKKSFEDMAKNLESNVTKLNEWRAMMKKMQQMGYSKDIIEYMASQGINSYAEVAALTAAGITSAQIDHVNQMWEQVDKQSEIGADEAFGSVAIAAGTAGRDTVDGVIAEVEDEIGKQQKTIDKAVQSTATATANSITSTLPVYKQAVQTLYATVGKEMDDSQQRLNNAIIGKNNVTKQLLSAGYTMKQITKLWKVAGMESVEGYINGVTNYDATKLLKKAGQGLAFTAINTFMNELGIASPSKEFRWMGQMCVEGLALGFGDNIYRATDEMDELSNSLVAYAQRLSDDLANAVPAEDEWTIKPVLDLDELQNAHSLINSMLGNGDIAVRSSTLASQTATQSEWSMLSKALSGVSGETTNNTYGDTQIIVNPPQGSNSREIAQMVMSEIQRQMDRRQRI